MKIGTGRVLGGGAFILSTLYFTYRASTDVVNLEHVFHDLNIKRSIDYADALALFVGLGGALGAMYGILNPREEIRPDTRRRKHF